MIAIAAALVLASPAAQAEPAEAAHLPPPPKPPEDKQDSLIEQQMMDVLEEPADESYVPVDDLPEPGMEDETQLDAEDIPVS